MIIYRLFVMAPLAALLACATDSARKAEVDALRGELRAVHDQNSKLEERLERLENVAAIQRRPASAGASEKAPPELTVIKLKPRTDPAPRIDTSVLVVEPSAETVQELARTPERAPPEDPEPSPDIGFSDAEYEQGLAALRTGNVSGGVTRLLAFAAAHPKDSKADNALYFAGLGQMGLEEYTGAAGTFERLLSEHPAGDAVQDGLLHLAECRVRLNQVQDAKVLYHRVVSSYPGTVAATQAEQRLALLP